MASRGGQPGNKNAEKRVWQAAIYRALEKRGSSKIEELDKLAEMLLRSAESGDLPSLKELGDRLEGKPPQTIDVGGQEGNPLLHSVRLDFK